MHDLKQIRENPEAFDAAMAKRGQEPIAAEILALDERNRELLTELQTSQARRNEASKMIGKAKAQGDEDKAQALMAEVGELKSRLPEIEDRQRDIAVEIDVRLSGLPNLPADDVPLGADEDANVELKRVGEPPEFDFPVKDHVDLGQPLGLDFETGAKIAGARFTMVRGAVARLHRALGQFGLDVLTAGHGYEEAMPPLLVREESMLGTGQLPKFADDSFKTTDGRWLIPTAEVSLTNIVREEILAEEALPLRFVALTSCFRSEAGSAGRDTRGYIRQHQFEKVEMVSITTPEASEAEHERMTACAEDVLTRLELPFRRMNLATGDLGFGAARTYDLEVWLPGQDTYREISSCSTCRDFQARRMNARYRPEGETKGTRFVHTLNGSGLVVGRMIVAILENYQQADGSVIVPDALRPYMNGMDRLEPAP
ncbi:serine--tRNA ligase [Parasphingopyxis algicola]|uniref:serine--tRNA ligase n=1 Tax=Parasphingopyxis algicola TaxID=2026624 RepID=UPI0015A4CFD1|nr:serine--tRNA ligase [Parasphingopyxis algicola]QLC23824.1 serine--tRNA ligase [Parasphingopyxis algicola]